MIALFSFAFFVGFLIESIVGFGGTLIAYSFLLFFFDIKLLIISTIILPIVASLFILLSDYKSINWKALLIFTPICLIGVPLGIVLFNFLPGNVILKILASFLILFGLRSVFFGEIVTNGLISKIIVFISGVIHGLIGTGGPIAIIGMKTTLKTKSSIRASMAVFFLILNIFRIIQLYITGVEIKDFFINIYIAIPMILGIIIGHAIHKKITEKQFKIALSIFFIIAGILLFLR